MTVATRIQSLLETAGVRYLVETHPLAFTAQEVAEATHVAGREMVKTIIAAADGSHVMLALPATARVDLPMLKRHLGAQAARLADEAEFARDFPDCELGAMPPFGKPYGLRLIASTALASDEEIVFNAGNHREVIRMSREDWERIAQPEWALFTAPR